ncbi:MAG: glutamate-5-semialdehyde dehydrogenase [Clostridia bacterium]
MIDVVEICKNAKSASYKIAGYDTEQKNKMLGAISDALKISENICRIINANAVDINLAKENGRDNTFIDRLSIDNKKIELMIKGLNEVIALPNPVGEIVEHRVLQNGLDLKRVRAPLGSIGIIYEARPNVTVDAAALCIKSGNAVVLRGSKEAINTNRELYRIMHSAIKSLGLADDAVAFIDDESREASKIMLSQSESIDVMIPRGGEGLKHFVLENATMPVIASAGGNCHIYVDKTADQLKAIDIIVNAKVQRPSVCNAAEHLIVDRQIASEFLPKIYEALCLHNVEIVGDKFAKEILPNIEIATEKDFETEFLTYKMSFAVVNGIEEAVSIINKYSTKHSEAILTEDEMAKNYFAKYVDAAAIYFNASTRFTDGFEFGLGAEMGISTQKLHARGPVALKELTSVKYVISGNGQIRK